MNNKEQWGSFVSLEKRELFEVRVETILAMLKQKFPKILQSSLEISKIKNNKVTKKKTKGRAQLKRTLVIVLRVSCSIPVTAETKQLKLNKSLLYIWVYRMWDLLFWRAIQGY